MIHAFLDGMAQALGAGVVIVGWRWLMPIREFLAYYFDPDRIHEELK